jgi:hypothetical protein
MAASEPPRRSVPVPARGRELDWIEGEVIVGGRARPEHTEYRARPRRRDTDKYPMIYEVRYPPLMDRGSVGLRALRLLPLMLVFIPLQVLIAAVFVLGWLAVAATKTYPLWLFNALTGALAFNARVEAYALLLTDTFPAMNETAGPVTLAWADPPDGRLSRWRVGIWKSALLLPHAVLLAFLSFAQVVVAVLAWFAILNTGRHPPDLFSFTTGVNRWRYRVIGYYASFNDRFPPFTPWANAGPAGARTVAVCAGAGLLVLGGIIGGLIASGGSPSRESQAVSFAALEGSTSGTRGWAFAAGSQSAPSFVITLVGVRDTQQRPDSGVPLPADARAVTFYLQYDNRMSAHREVEAKSLSLLIDGPGGATELTPALATVDGQSVPAAVAARRKVMVEATFFVPDRATVRELRLDPPWHAGDIAYHFQ